jgi:hypothetical protein
MHRTMLLVLGAVCEGLVVLNDASFEASALSQEVFLWVRMVHNALAELMLARDDVFFD